MIALAVALVLTSSQGVARPLALSPFLDGSLLLSSGLVEWAAIPLSRGRPSPCPCDPSSVPGFDRVAVGRADALGDAASTDLQVALAVAGPLAAAWRDPGGPADRFTAAAVSGEAILAASALTGFLKAAIHRPRPFSYLGTPGGPVADYDSMPSGHATAAFAAAASLLTVDRIRRPEDPLFPWLAAGSIAGATAVAWLRVESGHHFPSDVVAGAAVGTAVGTVVPLLHAGKARLLVTARSVGISCDL